MKKLVPRAKFSKKARRGLDAGKRVTWGYAPLNRKVASARRCRRKNRTGHKEWEVPQREMP